MRTPILIILAGLLIFQGQAQEKPTIRYEGSSTIANFIRDAESVYELARFEIKTESESSGGEQAILNGTTDLGGVARLPNPQVLGKGVVSTLIGWDAIAVIVNHNNPVNNLTKEQLKQIFTNKITNWKQLGGPDLKITPYIVEASSATRNVFRSAILGVDDYIGCKTIAPDNDILKRVSNDQGGIGQISLSFLLDSTHEQLKSILVNGQEASVTNQSYPITRPLYLLRWPGSKASEDFAKWTQSEKAQGLITKRFIGNMQETIDKSGKLIVYTQSHAVEEGGTYYYPHESYEIYSADGILLQHVRNHLESSDENPTSINLKPGQYLIWTETSKKAGGEKILVQIDAGQTTLISTDSDSRLQEIDGKPEAGLTNNLNFYGDFRFRAEQDWDSRKADGTYRDDRSRLRYRLRLGFNYKWNEYVTFGGRLRSGNASNPQSPHITLGENPPENGISIDKAFLSVNKQYWWGWLGKNSFPFWKQNELWWDDDVTPEGIALGGILPISNSIKIKPSIGYFIMHSLGQSFGNDPALVASQISTRINFHKSVLNFASGYYNLSDMPDRSDKNELHMLDYHLLISGAELKLKSKLPISLGIDNMTNLANYNSDTIITASGLQKEKIGYVFSFKIGSIGDKGKVLFAYYFSQIPKYSVVPYLAQDDWVRWDYGDIGGSRSSNFSGHEFRLAYALGKGFNVVARTYFVKANKKENPTDFKKETGNRFRLDFNLSF